MTVRRTLLLGGAAFAVAILVGVVLVGAVLHYMTSVPGRPHAGALPPLTTDEITLARRLAAHVIASVPHNIGHYDELEKSAQYIESELRKLGYQPMPQIYDVDDRSVRNIEVAIEPSNAAKARGTIVVGAHYDSFGSPAPTTTAPAPQPYSNCHGCWAT
jgi:hypothetical protein